MNRWLAVLLVGLLTLALPGAALGDGKVFLRSNAYATIPDQSALIAWRDGIETLAIETRFEGEGAPGAWIVPLPSVPLSIEPATTGLFPTLRQSVVPRVERGAGWFPAVALGWALMLIWSIRLSRGSRVQIRIIAFALISVVGFLLLPTIGRARSAAAVASGVKVIERQIVGAFDSAVIQGESGRALIDWLNTNGFSCDPAVEPVADELVRDGWVFIASRLSDTAESTSGPRAPHPLVFRFKTDRPVYPLRLTGVNNGELLVDLFVFAERQAQIPGWQTAQSRPASADYPKSGRFAWPQGDEYPVVHQGLRALVGDAPWLTRLRATLSPSQMHTDAYIDWTESGIVGASVRTASAAITASLALGFGAAAIISLGAVLLPRARLAPVAVCALVAGMAVVAIEYASDPPDRTVSREFHHAYTVARIVEGHLRIQMLDAVQADPEFVATEQWARELATRCIADLGSQREEDRSLPKEEDSPGNFIIRSNTSGVTEFVRFGPHGEEWIEALTP